MSVTFAIIKETKSPPDRRVVFSPEKCAELMDQYREAKIVVQSSQVRIFPDEEYKKWGFAVQEDINEADVMLGVKEVEIDSLIPNKKYFFFSHTIKKQPYNRELLKAILAKKIELYDHETIIDENGGRLIGFGYYAGLVGAYNGFRALGLRDKLFNLPKVETLADLDALKRELDKITLPSELRIILSGTGKVSRGAKEILDHLNIREVSDTVYLTSNFSEPVYCMIDVMEYNRRIDGKAGDKYEFYNDPSGYESNFMPYARVSDMFIAGHFYGNGAPYLFTREDARHPDFRINLVADISCDVDGPVASTLRASTIAEPFYGYDPVTEQETAFNAEGAITVMAVDNLPCELPKDASEGFGNMFLEAVIPAFFNGDSDGILERAKITTGEGTLTERFSYLQDYVDEKVHG
ncbi:alanine dehydrogenase [Pukyongia salina]|uniref:Saccharopine dehydrogenase [NAD(+), L-lysine-forming] n=1 Tax=Pukyongia salina TaxID=2094025 RepID=A0A2S0HTH6_9FLAO|nr:NAD(P)-dependent oxidoreductase [Pukyongia salina]AVI49952.1 alanine dehydrogenase [Pukyongia salina]